MIILPLEIFLKKFAYQIEKLEEILPKYISENLERIEKNLKNGVS